MTENTPATEPVVPSAATGATPPSAGKPAAAPPPRPTRKSGVSPAVSALVVVIVLAAVLAAALYMQRREFVAAGREVATRIDNLNSALGQTRNEARQALALAQAQAGKAAALENALRDTQSQYVALEQAWQAFNDSSSDEVLANDVERMLTIASQQLRLAGNVSNAIVALETAQARLARADRPRFASLQQAINGDLDRLRAVPTVDVPAQSSRIERLVALVGKAPLLAPDAVAPGMLAPGASADATPAAAPVAPPVAEETLPADAAWWQRWRAEIASWPARSGTALVRELGDLIRVQRVDEPSALLLSPEQALQLRSTLRQRLLSVQLSLLMRQPAIWKSELETVNRTLDTYFDRRSADTLAALNLTRELTQTEISVPVPDVADSLNAVAAIRASGATGAAGTNSRGRD
ncbi:MULTISPECIES: uroporphyrinogen-III C-methyltransferase [unclassified Achromobacter]|uniref:uroporphyrinogen-III C-methyltransferase n=1 Tax=unclassified Achromobacter TaxID=2626865 RepID=UPI000B517DAC|nr:MULTISPECIES: uroporphyrinogen-III C-methyltransferase [unclassified Achromobacter]OWT77200.1 heme biosynthesis operon protein HemX [Achromobacter sp. HZ28]OWT78081.1 heme biosynthesis operon protein HemX [Achromobacter sp. HZ34]